MFRLLAVSERKGLPGSGLTAWLRALAAVSYTHLTLPTILLV